MYVYRFPATSGIRTGVFGMDRSTYSYYRYADIVCLFILSSIDYSYTVHIYSHLFTSIILLDIFYSYPLPLRKNIRTHLSLRVGDNNACG